MTGLSRPIPPAVATAMLEAWGDGLSTAKIAQRIGTTKNAVIGKIGRIRVKFGARLLTIEMVARHIEDGGCASVFDGDELFGQFAVAEMRRGLGKQAR